MQFVYSKIRIMGGKMTKQKLQRNRNSRNNTGRDDNKYVENTLLTMPSTYPLANTTNFDTYLYMDGRKFYKDDTSIYILPSDSIEIQRTDFVHELYKRRWHNNFSSPVKEKLQSSEGGTVLDCG